MDSSPEEIIRKFEDRHAKDRLWWFYKIRAVKIRAFIVEFGLPVFICYILLGFFIKQQLWVDLWEHPLVLACLFLAAFYIGRERAKISRLERRLDELTRKSGYQNPDS